MPARCIGNMRMPITIGIEILVGLALGVSVAYRIAAVGYAQRALPDGYVYLRCFEVTKDIALSTKEIVKRTKYEFSDHRDYYTCAALTAASRARRT